MVGLAVTIAALVKFRPAEGSQAYPVGPLAVNTACPPEQIVELAILIAGGVVTITLTVAVTSLQPLVEPFML